MGYAVLFPGQGSQQVGMGASLFDLLPDLLGESADEVLGWSLRSLCLDGPQERLTRTEFAQPAIFAVSYALWTLFRQQADVTPQAAAGHSLGEYTALVAAGVLDYREGLSLVADRGRAMSQTADASESGMAALMGADAELAERVVAASSESGGTLQIANLNAPGQIVVAGGRADLQWLSSNARDHGVRRVITLDVAGAFHSSYMAPAASGLSARLEEVDYRAPQWPVWSNTTAQPHSTEALGRTLTEQIVSTVRFEESLMRMAESGVEAFVHIGPGDVTAGMARRAVKGAEVLVVNDPGDIPDIAAAL